MELFNSNSVIRTILLNNDILLNTILLITILLITILLNNDVYVPHNRFVYCHL